MSLNPSLATWFAVVGEIAGGSGWSSWALNDPDKVKRVEANVRKALSGSLTPERQREAEDLLRWCADVQTPGTNDYAEAHTAPACLAALRRARVYHLPAFEGMEQPIAPSLCDDPGTPDVFGALPFESVFFGFGRGLAPTVTGRAVLGYLAERRGNLWSIVGYPGRDRDFHTYPIVIAGGLEPYEWAAGGAWDVHLILDLLASHVTPAPAPGGFAIRRETERLHRKGVRATPPPFYAIPMEPMVVREAVSRLSRETTEYTHRWDVRAHTRLVTRRGTLPVDPDLAMKFGARGYDLFLGSAPSDVADLLASRGLPPLAETDWLAAKLVPVREHIKGPEDKPYVPGLRVVGGAA
jgi:hypothetical protein